MSIIKSNGAGETSGDFYNGVATTSVRFESGDSSFLSFTPGSAGNRKTMTFSCWVKRTKLGEMRFFGADSDNYIAFSTTNGLEMNLRNGGSGSNVVWHSNAKFRDTSNWYHTMFAIDTTQGTDTNRVKVYVNGSQLTSFAEAAYPGQNNDMNSFNNAEAQLIGKFGSDSHFSGYMAEVNFIDGLALTPSSFGVTKNGVWIPIDSTGLTFGNQGYHLQFKQTGTGTASTSTMGADISGNANHFTSSGLAAQDSAVPDSPENNFCILNANRTGMRARLTNGGLTYSDSNTSGPRSSVGTFGATSGKYYFEIRMLTDNYSTMAGFMDVSQYTGSHLATDTARGTGYLGWDDRGYLYPDQTDSVLTGHDFTTGDVLGFAIDIDAGKAFIRKNADAFLASADPSNGSNPNHTFTAGQPMTPFIGSYRSIEYTLNCGQDSTFNGRETATTNADSNGIGQFHTSPPSGYLSLCTANLPEPTIGPSSTTQATDHFNSVLYTGDASSTRAITGVGFKPDWVWFSQRNNTSAKVMYDSSRGVNKMLQTQSTAAEDDESQYGYLSVFGSDGFTAQAGSSNNNYINENNINIVAWNWKSNGGTTSSNSDGSVTTTVQANTTSGFSIVLYTGTGANATFGHGLGAVPKWIIFKTRSHTGNWMVYHGANTAAPETDFLKLDTTVATEDLNTVFNDTAPTSSVFSLGSNGDVNTSGRTQVAYVFAEVEGFSKFGTYVGNGNVDGATVFTGFEPAWVMIKRTDSADDWEVNDNKRGEFNGRRAYVFINATDAEATSLASRIDFLSNGFKALVNASTFNTNSATYVYMAFAKVPHKYANGAR